MSLFSRLARNLKRGLRKLAPIAASFIPGVGGVIAGVVAQATQRGFRTPGIAPDIVRPPLPGVGRVPPIDVRFLTGQTSRPVIQLPPFSQQRTTQMSIFAAIPAILRGAAPIAGRIGRRLTGRTAGAAGLGTLLGRSLERGAGVEAGACPSGWHLNKQDGAGGAAGTYCVRNRRMNFGNARAARRGVRRLKGARKLLKDIESMMPRRPAARARHGPTSPPHAGG